MDIKKRLFFIFLLTVFFGLLLGFSNLLTRSRIADNRQAFLLKSFHEIGIPFDNDLLSTRSSVLLKDFGDWDIDNVFAFHPLYQGKSQGTFLEASITGYAGPIYLLVALQKNATDGLVVQGVRVIRHQETPGLGDKIESSKTDWILQFNHVFSDEILKTKKQGGAFSQITSATITTNAILKGIDQVVTLYNKKFN